MKVIWATNTIFPDLATAIGRETPVVGGWMYGLASDLSKSGISLTVVTSAINITEHHTTLNGIEYYLLKRNKPTTEYDSSIEDKWKAIAEKINPNVVHIHGTEYAHGLSLMKVCPNLNYIISIQGLISVYSRYYLSGITTNEVYKNITLRDLLRQDNLIQAKNKFIKRGKSIENEYLRLATNIIGRTQWDQDHVKSANPNCNYHFCNESLRNEFYTSKKWNNSSKKDYTIFLSQAGYPIKGLHKVLEAVGLIRNLFPNIQIRLAGSDITQSHTMKDKLRLGGYGKYVKQLIRRNGLKTNIKFLGNLNAESMVNEYLNCHVFVCPSSIENSPNSLGEAQLLGTPCIAAYVGGIPDMICHEKTGLLYRFEEVEMLAQSIKRLFTDDALAMKLSENGIIAASQRHDREVNLTQLLNIYQGLGK